MVSVVEIWRQAGEYIKHRLGQTLYETWIQPLRPVSCESGNFIIEAPDNFFLEWVNTHYGKLILESLVLSCKEEVLLQLQVSAAGPNPTTTTGEISGSAGDSKEPFSAHNLNPRYTYENFVIGASNRHSHAYSLAVAKSPAKSYNPLFIYGGVGLGKTHLVQATCHYILQAAHGSAKICYISSEKFTNELISAIQHHSTNAFRVKYRSVDVLAIDDIHFIAGKESTQEEFFHTFNALYDAHKQIIISSDRPPREISHLQEKLVSRFSWGLTTDIQPPDLETRVAILKKKIEREPVTVPEDVIFFIAGLIKTNIRELEGALIRTIAYSLFEEKPVSLPLCKEVLKDLLKEPKRLLTVDTIQRCVAEEFGISLVDLKTKRRNKTIVLPRQVAMFLSRELTDLSLPEIGNLFGGKDHTTVLHSFKKIKGDLADNLSLRNRVDKLIHTIQQ